jgi:hypothetical protein
MLMQFVSMDMSQNGGLMATVLSAYTRDVKLQKVARRAQNRSARGDERDRSTLAHTILRVNKQTQGARKKLLVNASVANVLM